MVNVLTILLGVGVIGATFIIVEFLRKNLPSLEGGFGLMTTFGVVGGGTLVAVGFFQRPRNASRG